MREVSPQPGGVEDAIAANNAVSQGLSSAIFTDSLRAAVATPYPAYAEMGVKDAAGEWQQLNTNIIQIENEYYSFIRPKRVARSGERPTKALQRAGVEEGQVAGQHQFCTTGQGVALDGSDDRLDRYNDNYCEMVVDKLGDRLVLEIGRAHV